MRCFFVSDLHGRKDRYHKLFMRVREEPPEVLFMGGDMLPSGISSRLTAPLHVHEDFINGFLLRELDKLQALLKQAYPKIFLILGNDDGRFPEAGVWDAAGRGYWEYVHNRYLIYKELAIYGYAFVPPTPFLLKDFERYDVSRYLDPGTVSPEEGLHSIPLAESELRYSTIQDDLRQLTGHYNLKNAIFLFHAPPYNTKLDRADLDGKLFDHAPLDVHVGSIAIKRFIENRQPAITLHGHIHESSRLTGAWQDKIGKTHCFSAAHDGQELALIRFNSLHPEAASRELI